MSEGWLLLVGGDLNAKARLMGAAQRAGMELGSTRVEHLSESLRVRSPVLLVVDLDEGGAQLLRALEDARIKDLLPARIVGYFSHVDDDLGEAARRAGIEAMPRGRFWRSLPELLAPPSAP